MTLLLEEADKPVPVFGDSDVLLESGMDSLDFAVLVTRLEDLLGFDPFTEMDDPVYPQTLGELTSIYASFRTTIV
ncbi:MAG: acyl carrier protein [Acidimicrobiia bacterium]